MTEKKNVDRNVFNMYQSIFFRDDVLKLQKYRKSL